MKIQYCSDLHLEFKDNTRFIEENPIIPSADILILAGDITYMQEMYYAHPFFDYASKNWQQVYWVPGNHEYYCGTDINSYDFSKPIEIRKNVHIVNNYSININDIQLIFTSLWSKIDEQNKWIVERSVSDFHRIIIDGEKLTSETFNKLHEESLLFLKKELEESKADKKVIVTHHLPSNSCNAVEFMGSKINSAFCTELTSFVEKSNADFWIYGHSHRNMPEVRLGKTILLTNQLGYVSYNEHKFFVLDKIFDI